VIPCRMRRKLRNPFLPQHRFIWSFRQDRHGNTRLAEQLESVSGTHFGKHSHEAIACVPRPEEWTSPVTTEGNKVEVASSVLAS
jgi:hypothetical protein